MPTLTSRVARNALANYLGNAVTLTVSFFLLPYILGRLGDAQFGLWVVVASVGGYFSLFELGVGGSVVKTVAEHRERGDREELNALVSAGFVVFLGSGVAVVALTLAVAVWADRFLDVAPADFGSLRTLILVVGLHAALALPLRIFERVLAGYQRFDLVNVGKAALVLVGAGLTVLALEMGYGVVGLAAAQAAAALVSYALQAFLVRRVDPELRFTARGVTRGRLTGIGELSASLLLIGLAWQAIVTVDQLLVGYFLGLSSIAAYAVARKLRDLILTMVGPLGTVFFPLGAALAVEPRSGRSFQAAAGGTRICFAIALLTGVTLGVHAAPLIAAWVGPSYVAAAAPALRLLLVGAAASGAAWVAQEMLHASGGHRLGAILLSVEAVGGALLAVVLLPTWGVTGVAAAMAAASVLSAVAAIGCFVRYYLRHSVAAFARQALLPPVAVAAATLAGTGLLARALPPAGVGWLIAHLGASALLFACLYLALAASAAERASAREAWRALRTWTRRCGRGDAATVAAPADGAAGDGIGEKTGGRLGDERADG